jgi:uncharacterized protein YyaL (SSP411 family)
MMAAVRGVYLPTALLVPVTPAHRGGLERLLPWTRTMVARDGLATVYVCRDFACQAPTTSADELAAQLNQLGSGR